MPNLKAPYPQQRKQTVWFDETNFNLFCRRIRGRPSTGDRSVSVQKLPAKSECLSNLCNLSSWLVAVKHLTIS